MLPQNDSSLNCDLRQVRVGSRLPRRRPRAFTLVEVTIALGIVAFVVVGMLGVIPVGLSAAQESVQQTAESHILVRISSDLGMLPFDELASYVAAPQYYDYDGRRLDNSNGAIYTVSMQLGVGQYPNSSQLDNLDKRMERVIVNIKRAGGPPTQVRRTALSVGNSGL